MIKLYPLLLLSSAGFLSAQVTPTSVTVTAVRNANLQPDQIVFVVSVDTPLEATRDDVVSVLKGTGISAANFYAVRSTSSYDYVIEDYSTGLEWSFTLTAPIADMKTTIGVLSVLQKNIAANHRGYKMFFGLQGPVVSQEAQQTQACSPQDLISDARVQAQKLASATGASVGPVLAISGSAVQSEPPASPLIQTVGWPPCTLTVRFPA